VTPDSEAVASSREWHSVLGVLDARSFGVWSVRRLRMSTTKHNRAAACFYWIGVATSVLCVAVVLVRESELFWRFEHRGFPLSGVLAGVAALAFLVTELCDSLYGPHEAEEQDASSVSRMPRVEIEEDKSGELSSHKLRP
jgi:hypothetical protein